MAALGKIINFEDALEITACHSGALTSLEIQTRRGKYRFLVPTSVIVALRENPQDSNGNPWPVPGVVDFESAEKRRAVYRNSRSAEFERAWEIFQQDPTRPLNTIARELGLPDNSVSGYFIAKHNDEYVKLRAEYGRRMGPVSSERMQELEDAYDEYSKRGVLPVVLAARLQMSVPTLNSWFNRIRLRREGAGKREPILKPKGKIL